MTSNAVTRTDLFHLDKTSKLTPGWYWRRPGDDIPTGPFGTALAAYQDSGGLVSKFSQKSDPDSYDLPQMPQGTFEQHMAFFEATPRLFAALARIAQRRFLADDDADERDQMVALARETLAPIAAQSNDSS